MNQNPFAQYKPGCVPAGPVPRVAELALEAAAEGAVLLRNENHALPLQDVTVSVFGRTAVNTYKSGTGSGGMVNVDYSVSILDGLREKKSIRINEELAAVYNAWLLENPFDIGHGWGTEPWCQKEMPVPDEIAARAAEVSDAAVIVFGRTAGEDQDNSESAGSFEPTQEELALIRTVTRYFSRVIMVLNVGNVVSGAFCTEKGVNALLYVWQGGQQGGRAVADLLCGDKTPSGKLADTIAKTLANYPAYGQFGSTEENIYREDIYVGYRYFETFCPDAVLYPFGFGLSYTTFSVQVQQCALQKDTVSLRAEVTNTGTYSGKQVVQLYCEAPQGALGKPARELRGFVKTKLLAPGESEVVSLHIPLNAFASYDDSGKSNNRSCYVLEAGTYILHVGTDVRSASAAGSFTLPNTIVTERCTEALAPVKAFTRMVPQKNETGYTLCYEPVPHRSYNPEDRISKELPTDSPYTADRGIRFADVESGKASLMDFLAQLSNTELAWMLRGEGMNSEKVTAGTACAFGGITPALRKYGIPIACGTDGPSGIRLDSGAHATSIPNGTLLACTFNPALLEELYAWLGVEMLGYNIDFLLGPGINIHRHPLNGRNFEYFSEDPYLSGVMAAAVSHGLAKTGCGATIKHFTANNQELERRWVDSVASERAYREIYLKPYEIAVKAGDVRAIMTSYNRVNGIHAPVNYDLLTVILRGEWGYTGFVMTDWWPELCATRPRPEGYKLNLAGCVRAQNDVYMVCTDTMTLENNTEDALHEGTLHRSELLRCAANICRVLANSNCSKRFANAKADEAVENFQANTTIAEIENIANSVDLSVCLPQDGTYELELLTESRTLGTAQNTVRVQIGSSDVLFTVGGDAVSDVKHAHLPMGTHTVRCFFKEEQIAVVRLRILQ